MLSRLTPLALALIVAAGGASAADLGSAAPTPNPQAPVFSWTGFYAGTLAGYAFSDRQTIRTFGNNTAAGGLTDTQLAVAQGRRPATIENRQEGRAGLGGNVGYDHQFTPGNGIVVGVALDVTLVNQDGRASFSGPALAVNGFTSELSGFRQQLDWLGTVRGRVGYGFDRFLVYGTGGFAFGGLNYRAAFLTGSNGALAYQGEYDGVGTGFVYGGGIEYALPADSAIGRYNPLVYFGLIQPGAITAKLEYIRYDLGSRNVVVNASIPGGPTGSFTSRFTTEGNLIRGGITYRFGGL
ncbi:outer membrane protein [uncultured Enterovirga sp.]|uniref:outer membrane protein n=1 Tax=uncultured Enterovirga sp. TaxID=2026352 RepID=UPI0035C9FA81